MNTDSHWETVPSLPPSPTERFSARLAFAIFASLRYFPILTTTSVALLIIFKMYSALACVIVLWLSSYVIPTSFGPFPSFQAALFKYWYPTRMVNKSQIIFAHGSFEAMNRHKRAEYLDRGEISPYEAIFNGNATIATNNDNHSALPTDLSSDKKTISDEQHIIKQENDATTQKPIMITFNHSSHAIGMFVGGLASHAIDSINCGIKWLVAPALINWPMFRYIILLFGKFDAADRPTMHSLMQKKTDIALCPGGMEEAALTREGHHLMYLTRRFGFIRLALEHGYNIIPAYAFGEEYCYHSILQGKWSQLFIQFLTDHHVPISFFTMNLNQFLFALVPLQTSELKVVYGRPLVLPHIANPSKEEVQFWLDTYITGLRELFDEFKTNSSDELIIV